MQIAAIVLVFLGGVLLLVPGARDVIPQLHFPASVWQWISFGCIGFAALLYFLAPKD